MQAAGEIPPPCILHKKTNRNNNLEDSKIAGFHGMTGYIFWAQQLDYKEKCQRESLTAIAVSLRGTDQVVLDVVPTRLVDGVELELPYSIIGHKCSKDSKWNFVSLDEPCVIEFCVPDLNLLQFFSLEPISLTLPEKDAVSNGYVTQNKNLRDLCEHPRYGCRDKRLRQTISLLNLFNTHHKALMETYPSLDNEPTTLSAKLAEFMKRKYKSSLIPKAMGFFNLYITIFTARIAYAISSLLNWRYISLVNFSVLAQQIDLRCQQVCYFPVQYLIINEHHSLKKALPRFRSYSEASNNLRKDLPCKYYPDYIRFYNTVWLILNDVSFGMIFGSLIFELSETTFLKIQRVIVFSLYDIPKVITVSLANNPLGIKLNGELAKFFSDLFLWVIEISNILFIGPLTQIENFGYFLKIVSQLGCVFGGTFSLSIIVDYFAILTIHIYIFHRISSKIYHWQLVIMKSLFHLFCGKKKNVLRGRIDHNYFQLDQLLLGTIFFIILVFLIPTILMFYISFTALRMTCINIEILLESVIALLNQFPLFALLLRLKDPKRIPGGIILCGLDGEDTPRLRLKSKPLSIRQMFKPFRVLMDQMKDIYFSPKTLRRIILGLPIQTHRRKLYQALYSSLPNKPIDIETFYEKLLR